MNPYDFDLLHELFMLLYAKLISGPHSLAQISI
jgi:hypothetical protein